MKKSKFEVLGHDYNEYVVGYVIKTSKGDVNAQFDKCFSNHPEPGYNLTLGCDGDDTSDILNDDDRDFVKNYIKSCEEMTNLEIAYTKAMYNKSEFNEKTAPIFKWEIEEAAKFDESNQ